MTGLGTWQYNDTVAEAATRLALDIGYTHFDTAWVYKNAAGIGKALASSPRPRSSYFITSKIMGGNATTTLAQHEEVLSLLGIEYVDLLLVHFPGAYDPKTKGFVGSRAARQAQWKAMESLVVGGKARALGVSHCACSFAQHTSWTERARCSLRFTARLESHLATNLDLCLSFAAYRADCKRHLQDVLDIAKVKVAVNQVQFHVGMGSEGPGAVDDRAFDRAHGVLYQSFSSLCGPCGAAAHAELVSGPLVTRIGATHNKTGAQVSLKWLVQQGIPVIPKSSKRTHLLENLDLFDWKLSDAEMKELAEATYPPVDGNPGRLPTSGDCVVP